MFLYISNTNAPGTYTKMQASVSSHDVHILTAAYAIDLFSFISTIASVEFSSPDAVAFLVSA